MADYEDDFEIDPYIDVNVNLNTSVKDTFSDYEGFSTEYSPLKPGLLLSPPDFESYPSSTKETHTRPSHPTLRTSEDRDINIRLGFAPSDAPSPSTDTDIHIDIDTKDVENVSVPSPKTGSQRSSSGSSGFDTAPNGSASDERESIVPDENQVLDEAHEAQAQEIQETGQEQEAPEYSDISASTPDRWDSQGSPSGSDEGDYNEDGEADGDEDDGEDEKEEEEKEEEKDGDGRDGSESDKDDNEDEDNRWSENEQSGSGSAAGSEEVLSEHKTENTPSNSEGSFEITVEPPVAPGEGGLDLVAVNEAQLDATLAAYFAEQDAIAEAGVEQKFNNPDTDRTEHGSARTDYTARYPWNQFEDPESLELELSPSPPLTATAPQPSDVKSEDDSDSYKFKPKDEASQSPKRSFEGHEASRDDFEQDDIKQESPIKKEHSDSESSDDSSNQEDSKDDDSVGVLKEEESGQEDSDNFGTRIDPFHDLHPTGLPLSQDQLPCGHTGAEEAINWSSCPSDWPRYLAEHQQPPGHEPASRLNFDEAALGGFLTHPLSTVLQGVQQQAARQSSQHEQGQEKALASPSPSLSIASPGEYSSAHASLARRQEQYQAQEQLEEVSASPSPSLSIASPEGPSSAWEGSWGYREPYNPPLNPNFPFSFDTSTIPNSSQATEAISEQELRQKPQGELKEETEQVRDDGQDDESEDEFEAWDEEELESEDEPEPDLAQADVDLGSAAAEASAIQRILAAVADEVLGHEDDFHLALENEVDPNATAAISAMIGITDSAIDSSSRRSSGHTEDQHPESDTGHVRQESPETVENVQQRQQSLDHQIEPGTRQGHGQALGQQPSQQHEQQSYSHEDIERQLQGMREAIDRRMELHQQQNHQSEHDERLVANVNPEQATERTRFFERESAPEPETPNSANTRRPRSWFLLSESASAYDEQQMETDEAQEAIPESSQNQVVEAGQNTEPGFEPELEQDCQDQSHEQEAVKTKDSEPISGCRVEPPICMPSPDHESDSDSDSGSIPEPVSGKNKNQTDQEEEYGDPDYVPGASEAEQEQQDQQEEELAALETVAEKGFEREARGRKRRRDDDPEYVPGEAGEEQERIDQQEEKRWVDEVVSEQEDPSDSEKHGQEPESEQAQELKPEEGKEEEGGKGEEAEGKQREKTPSPRPRQKHKRPFSSSSSSPGPSKRQNRGRVTRTQTQTQPLSYSGHTQRRTPNRPRTRAATRAATTEVQTAATATPETASELRRGEKRKASTSPESSSETQKTEREQREQRKKLNNAPTKKSLGVYVFGSNSRGQLGLGRPEANITQPTLNTKLMNDSIGIVEVAAGGAHCIALTVNNRVLTWGANDDGQLGREARNGDGLDDGSVSDWKEMEPMGVDFSHLNLPGETVFVQVVATESASFVLTESGDVFGWGTFREAFTTPKDVEETIDIGFRPSIGVQCVPMHIPELTNVRRLAAGSQHVLAHTTETIKCRHQADKVDDNESESSKTKQKGKRTRAGANPTRSKRAKTDAATTRKSRTAKSGESETDLEFKEKIKSHVYAWGANKRGQLGRKMVGRQRTNASCLIPRCCVVPGLAKNIEDIASIGAGKYHSFVTKLDGSVYAWGYNRFGQTGVAERVELLQHDSTVEVPTSVRSLENQAAYTIFGGKDHSLALTADGRCFSWGAIQHNGHEPLGVSKANMSEDQLIYPKKGDQPIILANPTLISGIEGKITRIASGRSHSIAVTKKGVAYTWGSNSEFETGLPKTGGDVVKLPTALSGGELKGRLVVGAAAGDGFSVLLVDV